MKLVDSIEGVKRFMKSLSRPRQRNSSNDEMIKETAKRLGISRDWLGQNLKFEREAPKELKKAVKEEKMTISQATEIMKHLYSTKQMLSTSHLSSTWHMYHSTDEMIGEVAKSE